MLLPELISGDCLLYAGHSVFDWAIYLKTWSDVCHVEVYRGEGMSVASRNGIGVNLYPTRTQDLAYVLRPRMEYGPFDIGRAQAWFFNEAQGQAYGWAHLGAFMIPGWIDHRMDGMVCSPFATRYYRAGGFRPFADEYDADGVAPAQFKQSPAFGWVWVGKHV